MAIDFTKPIIDSAGNRLEKIGDEWVWFTNDGKPSVQISPNKSLVGLIRSTRARMGFYHFSGELRRWSVTIQDCYREHEWATYYALEDSVGYMVGTAVRQGKKFRQYRQSIENIRNCGEELDPKLEQILTNLLQVWESLDVPAE